MEKLSSLFGRLALTVAGALALGACNRSEYAMLPKSASYLGTKPAAYAPRPAAPAPVATTPAPVAPVAAAAPAAPAAIAEAAATEAAPTPARPIAAAPAKVVVAQPTPAVPDAVDKQAVAATTNAAQPKLSLMQRLALHKVLRKIDNQIQKIAPHRSDNTASTARVDGKLRYAIIFGAISLIFYVIGGSVGNFVGTILLIIALLFLVFWLLDAL